jgi:predicted peptidase
MALVTGWDSSWGAEFTAGVDKMLKENNNIKYTMLKKGTVVFEGMNDDGGSNHICTWRIAYALARNKG